MAFTVRVIERDELELLGGKSCDSCDIQTCIVGDVAELQMVEGVGTPLSPLED